MLNIPYGMFSIARGIPTSVDAKWKNPRCSVKNCGTRSGFGQGKTGHSGRSEVPESPDWFPVVDALNQEIPTRSMRE
jgi:hypothetical protein